MTARIPPTASRRGFILVAVLWILAALATLASIYSVYALNTASASRLPEERLKAEMAIRAGVELAAYQVMAAAQNETPGHGAFVAKLGDATIDVQYVSEGARVDLNSASPALLTGLFTSLGYDKAAESYAARIDGWRTEVAPNAPNKEAAVYKDASAPYPPRQGPFATTTELSLVLGIPPAAVARAMPYVTVYSGAAKVDVLDADPAILAALPDVSPDAVHNALVARAKTPVDKAALMVALGPAQAFATTEPNPSSRAKIVVTPRHGRSVQAEVVFRLDRQADKPFDILYWRDDFDAPF